MSHVFQKKKFIKFSYRQSMVEVEALEEEFHDLGNMFKFQNFLSIKFY